MCAGYSHTVNVWSSIQEETLLKTQLLNPKIKCLCEADFTPAFLSRKVDSDRLQSKVD